MSRIQLKNVKYAAFASEETHCYEASVYFDGKRVGTVKNDGHGGCDYQYPSDQEGWDAMIDYIDSLNELKTIEEKGAAMKRYCRQMNEWGDASYWEYQQSDALFYEQYKDDPHGGQEGNTLLDSALRWNNEDLEQICCKLVNDFLTGRDLKRLLRSKFLWQREDGNVYECKRRKEHTVKDMEEVIAKTEPTAKLLNAMPFEQALEIYKAI